MNFSEYKYDYWEEYGYFGVSVPQTFTMPDYQVLFAISTYTRIGKMIPPSLY